MSNGRSWERKIARTLNLLLWLGFLAALVIGYTPVTGMLLRPLKVEENLQRADGIVVLSAGIDAGNFLTLESAHRLLRGAQLYFGGKSKKILFAGDGSAKGETADATVMAQEARRLSIPSENILMSTHSSSLREAGLEFEKMTQFLRWKSILLVTSYCRMKRAVLVFENLGFKVYPAPADPYERYLQRPLARLHLFRTLLGEYGKILYYRLRGWI
jgi:uncharacterized SAM-binding protein YcdF (DUF218 family)